MLSISYTMARSGRPPSFASLSLLVSFASFVTVKLIAITSRKTRGSCDWGSNPMPKLALNLCKSISMRVSGIQAPEVQQVSMSLNACKPLSMRVPEVHSSTMLYEHCRVLNPCVHLRIRALQIAVAICSFSAAQMPPTRSVNTSY